MDGDFQQQYQDAERAYSEGDYTEAQRLASDLLELELAGQVVCESGFLWKPCRP